MCVFPYLWIDLKKAEGFADAQYRYWIEGIPRATSAHRWCVLRDVLHWLR